MKPPTKADRRAAAGMLASEARFFAGTLDDLEARAVMAEKRGRSLDAAELRRMARINRRKAEQARRVAEWLRQPQRDAP